MASNADPNRQSETDIDTVLFDLDGTLVEYDRTPGEVLGVAFERAGFDPFFEVEAYFERFDDHLAPDATIAESRANCFAEIAENCGRDPDHGRAVADAFAAGLRSAWVPAADGVEPDPEPHSSFESLAELRNRPW